MDELIEAKLKLLKNQVGILMSAGDFDTVEIIVTKLIQDGTHDPLRLAWGDGNWYARLGALKETLLRSKEQMKETVSFSWIYV